MKPIKLLVLVAVMLAPTIASAQYYGGPPAAGPGYSSGPGYGGRPFHRRWGRLAWGFSVGLGFMHDDGSGITNCDNCSSSLGFEADAHIGGMLSDRFALLLEGQWNARTVHTDANGSNILSQSTAMLAGQFWILPILWVKGGIGVAGLEKDDPDITYDYGAGMSLMGAVGVELLSARFFAIDLQARLVNGFYNGGSGNITAGTIGVGFNWY